MSPDTQVFLRSNDIRVCDVSGDTFRTAFFDHAFAAEIGIVSHPLKTLVISIFYYKFILL